MAEARVRQLIAEEVRKQVAAVTPTLRSELLQAIKQDVAKSLKDDLKRELYKDVMEDMGRAIGATLRTHTEAITRRAAAAEETAATAQASAAAAQQAAQQATTTAQMAVQQTSGGGQIIPATQTGALVLTSQQTEDLANRLMPAMGKRISEHVMREVEAQVMPEIDHLSRWMNYYNTDGTELVTHYRREIGKRVHGDQKLLTDGKTSGIISAHVRTFFTEDD